MVLVQGWHAILWSILYFKKILKYNSVSIINAREIKNTSHN
jgi:hypothetical protein